MYELSTRIDKGEVLAETRERSLDATKQGFNPATAPEFLLSLQRPFHRQQYFMAYITEHVCKEETIVNFGYNPRIAAQARVEYAAELLCTDSAGHVDLRAARDMLEPWQPVFERTKQVFELFGTS